MPFQPAIDDPSKAWPLSNLSIVNCFDGTVTCCSLPRVSVKRRSTNLTSFSFSIFSTSAGAVICNLLGLKRKSGGWAKKRAKQKPELCHHCPDRRGGAG